MRYLSEKELAEKFSVSRMTIWNWRTKSGFPKPVNIAGSKKNLWLEKDVDSWAKRNTQKAERMMTPAEKKAAKEAA